MSGVECNELEDQLEELALGQVAEPARSRLHAHMANCGSCRNHFDEMIRLTEGLLALAPHHEPPPGFESRVLDQLSIPTLRRSPKSTALLGIAAALLVMMVAVGAVTIDRRLRTDEVSVARSGVIVSSDGSRLGDIQLVRAPRPYVLVTMDNPPANAGSVTCQLQLADGRNVIVGSWSYGDVRGGVWAAGLDDSWLAAVAMQIVDSDGSVVASASL